MTISNGELFELIYEDNNILVINKPADLVCHPQREMFIAAL